MDKDIRFAKEFLSIEKECKTYLEQFSRISSIITSTLEIEEIKKRSATIVMENLECEAASLLIYDEEKKELFFDVVLGEKGEKIKTIRLKLGQGIAGWVAQHREPLIINDVQSDPRFFKTADKKSGFITRNMICIPVLSKNRLLGVFQVINKKTGDFSQSDLEFVKIIGNQIAVALENAQLYEKLKKTFEAVVFALAETIEQRDKYTGGHTKRVTEYSVLIGEALNLSKKEIYTLKIAAILHDIGKIAVPDQILNKPGRLTDEEFAYIKIHPVAGAEILKHIPELKEELKGIKYHHERWDGKGYPEGLKGDQIPFIARIIAVADTFDAMTSNRPYRKALPLEVAFEEVKKCAGTQFDPQVAEAFLKIQNKIKEIYPELIKSNLAEGN